MPILETFRDKPIVNFLPGMDLAQRATHCYRLIDPRYVLRGEQPTLAELIAELGKLDELDQLAGLVIGSYAAAHEHDYGSAVEALIAIAPRLSGLRALYIGDVHYTENELNWINHVDLGPLIVALPELTALHVRGSNGLRLSDLRHRCLERLTLESYAQDDALVRDVVEAELPALVHLDLWLGESWGPLEGIMPLLHGRGFPELSYPFPKLRHLGLRNARGVDAILEQLEDAPVLEQVEVLDMTMGRMTNRGARYLRDHSSILAAPLELALSYMAEDHDAIDDDLIEQLSAYEGVYVEPFGEDSHGTYYTEVYE